jgi:membrane protease YdiL (CAAX protease family)
MPPRGAVYRTSPRDSWRWMRLDLVIRLVPLSLLPLLYAWLAHAPISRLGVSLAHPVRDVLISVPIGLGAFVIAAAFADFLSRRRGQWFVPSNADLAVQSAYYIALNAPIEEWFFRGFVQGELARWWGVPALSLVAATALFGGYHFLDGWGWRPVAGATVAGLALGLIYLWQPQPASLLAPILVHAAITCGFLGVGPYLIFRWRQSHGQIDPAVERTPVAL